LEGKTSPTQMHIISFPMDERIPFCEYFILPYFFWFVYMIVTGAYFFLTNRRDFYRYCLFLFTGMSVSLFICQLWPNGLALRPDLSTIGRDNIFVRMVNYLYTIDTPTNVCPSIHVINSIGATVAILKSESLMSHKGIRIGSFITCIAICASTLFLKQHSCFDVICACGLCIGLYILAYNPKFERIEATVQDEKELWSEA
ncbi:MAG: phosphoesterase, partial [Lachnospiraceae bacterium]|nr:phosphoesterase [Lachnospiraceae bacterium]